MLFTIEMTLGQLSENVSVINKSFMIILVCLIELTDVPIVSSSQIKQSPAVLVEEGDNASVTCEKPLNQTTKVQWTLSRSPQHEPIDLNDSVQSVLLADGKKLRLMFENFTENCSSDGDLMCFRLTIFELTQDLTGLTVGCSVSLNKEEELSAVIVVMPTESK